MSDLSLTDRHQAMLAEVRAGNVSLHLELGDFLIDGHSYDGLSGVLSELADAGLIVRTSAGRATLPDFNVLPMVLTDLGEEATR